MNIPILIEPILPGRFRALGAEPFADSVEANSPEEALAKMQRQIQERINQGACIATIELSNANPWLAGAGLFKNDPYYAEWQKAITESRREIDANDAAP